MARRIGFSMPSGSTSRSRFGRGRVGRVATIALLVAGVVQAPAQPVFRAETNLVALQVTVVDAQQRYVPDLRADDFRVLEEGDPQTIRLFAAAAAVPLDLMLLVDTSASMVGLLSMVRHAALNFVRLLGPDDRAAIVLIKDRAKFAQPLTNDVARLERALSDLPISGGTALYDSLYIALRELSLARRNTDSMRRTALVVLTDGWDTSSRVSFDDVFAEARGSAVAIYSIVPVETAVPYDRPQPTINVFEMRRLAEQSGGRAFRPERLADLSGAYDEILAELRHQYWLAYASPAASRGFRRVSVQIVTNPTMRARTRAGYYAGASRPGE